MVNFYTKLLSSSIILLLVALSVTVTRFVPSAFAAGNDDSDNKEVGAWWINNYHGQAGDLTWSDEDAEGFYNELGSRGFTRRFDNGDDAASERHFEKASVGGQDSNFVDDIDFVYFSGHGTSDAFHFGTNNDGDGSYTFQVHYSEADWGDRDLEWIFLSACLVLQWSPSYWSNAFHNPITLHGMTGFATLERETDDLGTLFARYLTDSALSIHDAWRQATINDPHQPSDRVAAIYAVAVRAFGSPYYSYWWNEYLPGIGSGMKSDPPLPRPGVLVVNLQYDSWSC